MGFQSWLFPLRLAPSASSRRVPGADRIALGSNTSAWAISHYGSATRGGILQSVTGLPSGVSRARRATPYPQHRPPSHRVRASSRSSPSTVRLAFPSCTVFPRKASIHPTSEEVGFLCAPLCKGVGVGEEAPSFVASVPTRGPNTNRTCRGRSFAMRLGAWESLGLRWTLPRLAS